MTTAPSRLRLQRVDGWGCGGRRRARVWVGGAAIAHEVDVEAGALQARDRRHVHRARRGGDQRGRGDGERARAGLAARGGGLLGQQQEDARHQRRAEAGNVARAGREADEQVEDHGGGDARRG